MNNLYTFLEKTVRLDSLTCWYNYYFYCLTMLLKEQFKNQT